MALLSRLQWRFAFLVILAPAAGGCIGLSIPLGETREAPAITGAVDATWARPFPLPAGLDASDAAVVAETARHALAASDGVTVQEWQNAATGSRGSLRALGDSEADGGETCRLYAATVTSLKGVHRYVCRACRTADGGVIVRSIAAAAEPAAGI